MKCPYCGYEDEGLGTTCDNCWREIRNFPGTYRACRSCGTRIPVNARFCPECGAGNDFGGVATDEVLAREDFGPLWTGAPMEVSYRMYEDKVEVRQNSLLTGTRTVTTMKKPVFWAGNLIVMALNFFIAVVFMTTGVAIGFGPLVFVGLLFMCLALYSLFVFLRMEAKAADRKDRGLG